MAKNLAYIIEIEDEQHLVVSNDFSPPISRLISSTQPISSKNISYPYYALLSFIILDGLLTFYGVSKFGLEVEANSFVRIIMEYFGPLVALIAVKSSSFLFLAILWILRNKISWLTKAVTGVSVAYLFFAVLPWTYLIVFI